MPIISASQFIKVSKEFDKREGRSDFFPLAKNLIDSGFEAEGFLLILTTWNSSAFRYAAKGFDIAKFKKTIQLLKPYFNKLNGQDFQTINFDEYKSEIQSIYNLLCNIQGIGFTGTPKLMHLKNPKVFVMWDAYIRGEKPKKHYDELPAFQNGSFTYKKYAKDFYGYFEFLKDMQDKFKHINLKGNKLLAKAVDEFNYVNITLEIQDIEKKKRKTLSKNNSSFDRNRP